MTISRFNRYALTSVAFALLAGCGGSQTMNAAPTVIDPQALTYHHTFHYAGKKQSFKVPLGVKWMTVVALGAAGGALGGRGAASSLRFQSSQESVYPYRLEGLQPARAAATTAGARA
jgi:hypothetical protein